MPMFLGIDPGQSGGMASLIGTTVELTHLARSMNEILDWIRTQAELSETITGRVDAFCVLEQVGGYVARDEGQAGMGPSMFAFGVNYGMLQMALCACKVPFVKVIPRKWQKSLDVVKGKGEPKTEYKTRLMKRAKQLFPCESDNVTKATADALLLAHYGRMIKEGRLKG